jgi:hypothetical protein
MTDAELNDIFRAIRHRRTLSWATIEKLANEVRRARKPQTLQVQTTMFPQKPNAGISQEGRDFLDRVGAIIRRKYEDKVFETLMGKEVTYTNTDPKRVQVLTLDDIMKRVMFVHESAEAMGLLRERSAFRKFVVEPIADSQKKE